MATNPNYEKWYERWKREHGKDCPACFASGQALGKAAQYGDICPVCKGKGVLR